MKRFSKLIGVIVVFMVMMVTFCSVSFAATVGQALTSPESGWQRIDDTNLLITYKGDIKKFTNGYPCYNNTYIRLGYNGIGSADFVFYGSKIRIISYCNTGSESQNVQVKIDGVIAGNYDNRTAGNIYQLLIFEKSNLTSGAHHVEITSLDKSSVGSVLDAIDIDTTGYLVDAHIPNVPTNLKAIADNNKVTLSWNSVSDATSYNIYRSEKSSSRYTKIGSTTSEDITTYTDTTAKSGTTYYYVVTAVTANGESQNSNEVSATLQATNQLKLVLEVNEEKQLSVSDELSDNIEMDWVSSDSTIATVNENGKVKAIKSGNTVVTCTSEDKLYTESINVLIVDLEYQLAVDLTVGDSCRLTVDDLANATNVTWSSYDANIATVTSKGKVTAISEGLTYIVASDKDGNEIGRIYIRVRK